MVTIGKEEPVVTLIVTFPVVEPSRQQELVERIVDNFETVIKTQPGFISSTIHKSLDGTKVVNYVQWKSREEYEAYIKNYPAVSFPMDLLKGPPDARLYEIEFQGVHAG